MVWESDAEMIGGRRKRRERCGREVLGTRQDRREMGDTAGRRLGVICVVSVKYQGVVGDKKNVSIWTEPERQTDGTYIQARTLPHTRP